MLTPDSQFSYCIELHVTIRLLYINLSNAPPPSLSLSVSMQLCAVSDKQPVPLRWTPAEALFDEMFSEKSMVYSLAFFIYECWTHGCQPFTDYDKDMQTKDIVHLFHVSAERERENV